MSYSAEFKATEDFEDVFVPWKAFTCSYHGKSMDWFCPRIYHQLDKVNSIGLATHYPLKAETPFELKIASISAKHHTGPKEECPFGKAFKAAKSTLRYLFFGGVGNALIV